MSSNLEGKPSSAPKGVGWLAPYRDTFLTELGRLGYAAKTIGDYQRGRVWLTSRLVRDSGRSRSHSATVMKQLRKQWNQN